MLKDSGEHGHQWDAFAIVWRDGSGSDEIHRQASNSRYGFCQDEALEACCSWVLLGYAVLPRHV